MDNFETTEAIKFANQCIANGIINDSINALSCLNDKRNGFEANQYFWEATQELGLEELSNENAIVSFIKSYLLDIIDDDDKIKPLTKLYQYYLDTKDERARVFYLLFWSHKSHEINADNKDCYFPDYDHNNANELFVLEAKKYLQSIT